jgi:formylmethanofuran dehydrogenase subunit E
MIPFILYFAAVLFLLSAPVSAQQSQQTTMPDHHGAAASAPTHIVPHTKLDIIEEVKEIHGGAGPFVVAGYRMGQRAVQQVGAQPGAFTLLVQHYCPAEVQWSCIVDGLQAATHTSLGKLNLERITASKNEMRSIITNRKTGMKATVRLSESFLNKYLNTLMEQLETKGREVASLKDEEIFIIETTTQR